MDSNDGFPLVVLSDHGEEPEPERTGTAWYIATVISSGILNASILGVVAAVVVFAALVVGDPRLLFANAAALLAAWSPPQNGIRVETRAPVLPPIASRAPTDNQIAAPFQAAERSATAVRQAPAEAVLGQFQAWAAEHDARAEPQPVPPAQLPAAQEARVDPVQESRQEPRQDSIEDARAEIPPAQEEHRAVRRVKNVRAEIRARQERQAKIRREQTARIQARPAQQAGAQEPSAQNAEQPSFLQSLGLQN
jgi:hypothetical protein